MLTIFSVPKVYDSPDGKLTGKPQIYKTAAVAEGAKTYNTAGMVHVCVSPPPSSLLSTCGPFP